MPDIFEVRGEAYLDKAGFEKLNQERKAAGLPLFANPRNAAAGSLKHLDPKMVVQRPLGIVFYGTGAVEGADIEINSNTVERAMRPIALNRKNALFAGSDEGAQNWAMLASLIETCKLHSVNPQAYLTDVLTKLVNQLAGQPPGRTHALGLEPQRRVGGVDRRVHLRPNSTRSCAGPRAMAPSASARPTV